MTIEDCSAAVKSFVKMVTLLYLSQNIILNSFETLTIELKDCKE